MPITVTLPQPSLLTGPGLAVQFVSDFIGPLPANSQWNISIDNDPEFSHPVYVGFEKAPNTTGFHQLYALNDANNTGSVDTFDTAFEEGQAVHVRVQLMQNNGNGTFTELDSGTEDAVWSNTAGMAKFQLTRQGFTNSLTQVQSAQLDQIQQQTQDILGNTTVTTQTQQGFQATPLSSLFQTKSLDLLTLTEVSPGPTSDPVTHDVQGFFFGVIVRLTAIPANLEPATPSKLWYYPDLAVLTVFRGVDMEFREGIHTPSYMKPMPWQYGSVILNETFLFGVPPAISIQVDWMPGAAGQVFLMQFP